VKQTNQ